MKILALVASQDSTVEDVKTNGRRQMQALIGKDKEVLFCEYSTIEICRNGELAITCLGEKWKSRIISGHYLIHGWIYSGEYASRCGNSIYFKSA